MTWLGIDIIFFYYYIDPGLGVKTFFGKEGATE